MRLRGLPLLLSVVGCASVAPTQVQPYFAVDRREQSSYPEAAFHGSVMIANGCVVLRQTGSGRLNTPIFPPGTRLVFSRGGSIELNVRGKRVRLGREYVIGGGFMSAPASDLGIVLAAPIPAACPASQYIVSEIQEKSSWRRQRRK